MDIKEMRKQLGDSQSAFALRYSIPFRTIQNWETGLRKPPEYLLNFLQQRVKSDLVNRKTVILPQYDPSKIDLPKRSDYIGSLAWLKAIKDFVNEDIVFALDEALMCQGNFAGRSDEYLVWAYGNDSLLRFNGIVLLANQVSSYCVEEKNSIRFTNFNRTLSDALANQAILDKQAIIESLSKYYYSNNESFNGIIIPPEYQQNFEELVQEAITYYDN